MCIRDSLRTWDSAAKFGALDAQVTVHKGETLFPRIDLKKELALLEEAEAKARAATQESAKKEAPKQEEKLEGIAPVSYTHLDVYKRQAADHAQWRCGHERRNRRPGRNFIKLGNFNDRGGQDCFAICPKEQ